MEQSKLLERVQEAKVTRKLLLGCACGRLPASLMAPSRRASSLVKAAAVLVNRLHCAGRPHGQASSAPALGWHAGASGTVCAAHPERREGHLDVLPCRYLDLPAVPDSLLHTIQELKATSIDSVDLSRCRLCSAARAGCCTPRTTAAFCTSWQMACRLRTRALCRPQGSLPRARLAAQALLTLLLRVRSNKLDALPSLGALKALRTLLLKYNNFGELPPTLSALHQLEVLDVSGNQLRTLDNGIMLALPRLRCAVLGQPGHHCIVLAQPVRPEQCLHHRRCGGTAHQQPQLVQPGRPCLQGTVERQQAAPCTGHILRTLAAPDPAFKTQRSEGWGTCCAGGSTWAATSCRRCHQLWRA